MTSVIKLDYTLESPEERKALVEKIIAETPDISPAYLEILGNYLVLCMEKQERKERNILTDNRMTTVNKRECSFEGLVSQLENGEDGIYNLVNENKNVIFQPKISITDKDLETIPCLKQLRDTINAWEAAAKHASGKTAFMMKKALIEMRKDQYIIKQAYQKPIIPCRLTRSARTSLPLDDKSYLDGSEIVVDGISLMDTKVVSAILCKTLIIYVLRLLLIILSMIELLSGRLMVNRIARFKNYLMKNFIKPIVQNIFLAYGAIRFRR